MHLQPVKRDAKFKAIGMLKGYYLSIEGIRREYFFSVKRVIY